MPGRHRASPPAGRPVRASWLGFGAAAAVILTLISVIFTGQWYQARASNRLMVAMAEEMAAIHVEMKPLEIQAGDVSTVFAYFGDLDFQLPDSPRLGRDGEALVGGRYCSIQGVAAAQFRFMRPDGGIGTWYVSVLPADQIRLLPDPEAGQTPSEFFMGGIRVRLWTGHGLVFGEARPAYR